MAEENIVFPTNIRHGDDDVAFSFFIVEETIDADNKVKVKTGPFDYTTTWDRLLTNLLDLLYSEPSEQAILSALVRRAKASLKLDKETVIEFAKDPSRMIRFQFEALGLVTTFNAALSTSYMIIGNGKPTGIHWRLSDLGKRYISRLNAASK